MIVVLVKKIIDPSDFTSREINYAEAELCVEL